MQIPEEILEKWWKMWDRGDNRKIAELTELNESTVSRLINGKQETDLEVIETISGYFTKKMKRLKKVRRAFN